MALAADLKRILEQIRASNNARGVLADRCTPTGDNTAYLAAIASKYTSLTAVTVVDLPHGNVPTATLPLHPGVVWRLNGTRITHRSSGPTKHLVSPADPAWITATDGTGAHRSGLIGTGIIDGESDSKFWGIRPAPKGPSMVSDTATGTLAAGWYSYWLAYVTSFGVGLVGPEWDHELTATGGVKLTWTNPSTAAGMQVAVYGRAAWDRDAAQRLALLPAGTTTWTDTGAATPGEPMHRADLSAPAGAVMTGVAWQIDGDIKIKQASGTGLASFFFGGESAANAPLAELMEARARGLRVELSGAECITMHGVHDTSLSGIFTSRPGYLAYEDRTNVLLGGQGPYAVSDSHFWGTSTWALENYAAAQLTNVSLEGFKTGALNAQHRTMGACVEVFFPQTSTAKGVVIGNGGWKPIVTISALSARSWASTGAVVDATAAGDGTNISGSAQSSTAGATLYTGTTAGKAVSLVGAGTLAGQTITPTGSGGGETPTATAADLDALMAG